MLFWLTISLAILSGVIAGAISGLIPGLHINLISAVLLSLSALVFSYFSPIIIVIFIVSMSIAHIFINYIPSIFLGAPDEDNFLAVLPGHELLLSGKGYSAVIYSIYGCIAGIPIVLLFSPLFYFYLSFFYSYAERIMPIILIIASIFLVYSEKSSKLWAFFIFCFSGIIGLSTLTLPNLTEPLLPLFTGLFGISSLATSLKKTQKIPQQEITPLKAIKIERKSFWKSIFASAIASPFCSFLPGMGSGQAAVIASEISGEVSKKEFLVLLGSINIVVTGLSFITLYSISKARTGVAAAVGKIITLDLSTISIITGAIVFSAILAFFLTILIAKAYSRIISKIDYKFLSAVLIIFLSALIFYFSGWLGLIIMLVSASLGLLCIYSGVRRTHMLGSLIIPAIILYLL